LAVTYATSVSPDANPLDTLALGYRDAIVEIKEMQIRDFILVALTLGFSSSALAGDPFVGTWKLNTDKSTGRIPTGEVVTIERRGQTLTIEVRVVTGASEDQSFVIRYTSPVKGGAGKIEKGPYNGVSLKRLGSSEMEITYLTDGKEARSTRAVVSKDGKTLTSSGTAQESGGSTWTMVFERQPDPPR
jgi:hypothetical protein